MSFLFGQKPQLSSEQKLANAETEVEMIADMYSRLQQSCTAKCVPTDYREGELNKGESTCLDRCAAKFFEINIKVSERMQSQAAQNQAAPGGGGNVFGL